MEDLKSQKQNSSNQDGGFFMTEGLSTSTSNNKSELYTIKAENESLKIKINNLESMMMTDVLIIV